MLTGHQLGSKLVVVWDTVPFHEPEAGTPVYLGIGVGEVLCILGFGPALDGSDVDLKVYFL